MYPRGILSKKEINWSAFDMTLVQMELKIAKLKQEQQEQNLAKAQKRLDKPSEWRTG